MQQHVVNSFDDPVLAVYRDLKRSNLTRWSGRFIAEGDKVVLRLLASDFEVESVLAAESFLPAVVPLLQSRPTETHLFIAPDELVPQVVGFNFHRGLLACGVRKPNPPLEAICPPIDQPARIVVCPDVQGPENLGQIVRTSCALGVDGIMLGPRAGDPYSRRVLRVSMGAALSLPIYESSDLSKDLQQLKCENEIERIATVIDHRATPLSEFHWPRRVAIMFGSEGHGLPPGLIELSDYRLTVPISRTTDSLNVAVAAGIILHSAFG
jgi:tRNA G18 (ribose-2'-O)-methylase SpoU